MYPMEMKAVLLCCAPPSPNDNGIKAGHMSLRTHWLKYTLVMISYWMPATFAVNQSFFLYLSELGMVSYLNPLDMEEIILWQFFQCIIPRLDIKALKLDESNYVFKQHFCNLFQWHYLLFFLFQFGF